MGQENRKLRPSSNFSSKKEYLATVENRTNTEIKEKKLTRNSHNLPLSAFTAKNWCHYFSKQYYEIYGKKYPNYPSKLESESIILSNIVYPIVFDELKYSAREFADFLKVYLTTRNNARKELVVMMLKEPASKSKYEYYIKKYRRIRKKNIFESLVYIPHSPITSDPDDLQLILESSNLNSIQMLTNYGIPIFHRYLMIYGPMSYDQATKKTHEIILKEILIKYKDEEELVEKILTMIFKNSVLWEPYSDNGHVNGIEASGFFHLNWREEFSKFWRVYSFHTKDWWRSEEQMAKLPIIPTVKKFFSLKIS